MRNPHQPDLPDDLRMVEERLRQGRAGLSPLEYDGVKRRVLDRFAARERRPNLMRSRLAAAITTVLLLGGAGGAVALSGSDNHANVNGGAAKTQYKPGKGCGDKNHQHQRKGQCKGHHNKHKGKHGKGKGAGPGKNARYGKGAYRHDKLRHHHHHHHHHHGKKH